MTPPILIVMRLADMHRLHPDQITANCSKCGEPVGVYPSGQRVIKQYPDTELVCQVCKQQVPTNINVLAPGAEDEPSETYKRK